MRRLVQVTLAVILLVMAGCGPMPRSRVHGTVRFNGQPLTNATLIFLASDNQAYPVRLKSDGSYELPAVPQGRIQVSIQADQPKVPPRPAPDAGKAGDDFATRSAASDDANKQRNKKAPDTVPAGTGLPAIFADPTTSGLSFDLTENDQEYSPNL